MVKKIAGFDEKGNKVFERDAREYDQSVIHKPFQITLSDLIKVIPIFFACAYVYINQNNFNNSILQSFNTISVTTQENTKAIDSLKDVLSSLMTGKKFKDGMPD